MTIQKNVLILIGVLSLSYIAIFLLAPKDITSYTIVDTAYWGETKNRLLLSTVYDYNNKDSITSFPKTIGEWKSFDYKYPDWVYAKLNADILMSRGYQNDGYVIWMDIISSKTGESFHKQKICVEGAGWTVDDENIVEFKISDISDISKPKIFTRLRSNMLNISKGDKKQVMVYWFMFKKFGSNNSVTMIRLSAPVRNNKTDETHNSIRNFIEKNLFDVMYKDEKKETTTAEYLIEKYGNNGKIVMMLGMLIPVSIIITGIRKKD